MKPISRELYEALQEDPFYGLAAKKMVKKGYWKIVDKNEN
jgi:hypothetical protein